MKTFAIIAALLIASASAFAPIATGDRVSTAQNALADRIFGMDLFAPNADQNKYGARNKKNIKTGKLTDSSYVPSGMTKAQYEKIRDQEQKKKQENYQKNVAKAGKFIDFTDWYAKRGTELSQGWRKDVNLGHNMAKTKYDWASPISKQFESTVTDKLKIQPKKQVKQVVKAVEKTATAAKKKAKYFY